MTAIDEELLWVLDAGAHALLSKARVDPRDLLRRYVRGDLGEPTPLMRQLNADLAARSAPMGLYVWDGLGAVVLRGSRSGTICIMDAETVLASLGGLHTIDARSGRGAADP